MRNKESQICSLTSGTEPWTRHAGVKHYSDVWQCEQAAGSLLWSGLGLCDGDDYITDGRTHGARRRPAARCQLGAMWWGRAGPHRKWVQTERWDCWFRTDSVQVSCTNRTSLLLFTEIFRCRQHAVRPGRSMCIVINSQLREIHPFLFLRVLKLFLCCSDSTSRDLKLRVVNNVTTSWCRLMDDSRWSSFSFHVMTFKHQRL